MRPLLLGKTRVEHPSSRAVYMTHIDRTFLEFSMHRNYQSIYSCVENHQELTIQTAFHEAGHATSIYLGNKKKKLPPVFFQIKIKKASPDNNQSYFAKVTDGYLIQSLPIAFLDDVQHLTKEQKRLYQSAYEADIINLLVGPLAEAKYVSIRDNEIFSLNLLNTHSLTYYGGYSDVKKAYKHLACFIISEQLREQKMLELFSKAFHFVKDENNWTGILGLAQYMMNSDNETVSCEEAIKVIDGYKNI
jgi:hypothetical protein